MSKNDGLKRILSGIHCIEYQKGLFKYVYSNMINNHVNVQLCMLTDGYAIKSYVFLKAEIYVKDCHPKRVWDQRPKSMAV